MKKHLYDFAVCAVVLIFAVLLLLIPTFTKTDSTEKLCVKISVCGTVEKTLPLNQNEIYECSNGVIVTVNNGYAEICHSPCKDKLCMRNSKLNKNGESAVCLPLKTIVAICEENGQSEVDGVVG